MFSHLRGRPTGFLTRRRKSCASTGLRRRQVRRQTAPPISLRYGGPARLSPALIVDQPTPKRGVNSDRRRARRFISATAVISRSITSSVSKRSARGAGGDLTYQQFLI